MVEKGARSTRISRGEVDIVEVMVLSDGRNGGSNCGSDGRNGGRSECLYVACSHVSARILPICTGSPSHRRCLCVHVVPGYCYSLEYFFLEDSCFWSN